MKELNNLVTQMDSSGVTYREGVRQFKRAFLREILTRHHGNQCKAAGELGMHRNTLARTMDELGLSLADVRPQLRRPVQSETFSFMRRKTGSL